MENHDKLLAAIYAVQRKETFRKGTAQISVYLSQSFFRKLKHEGHKCTSLGWWEPYEELQILGYRTFVVKNPKHPDFCVHAHE